MAQTDFTARLTEALSSVRQSAAALVTETPAADSPGCGDPGCARHAGTSNPPHFAITRRSGVVLGESIADAWYGSCGSSRMDIPTGVVAALALWPVKSRGAVHAGALSSYIAAQPPRVLVKGYAEVHAATWMLRPDLMDIAAPIFRWTEEDLGEQELRGIAAVTQAALRAGVLQFTGDSDPYFRCDIDLMSWTITNLRHSSSRKGLGEYHTPPEITDLMARMLMGDDTSEHPHVVTGGKQGFSDPAAGTGGMARSWAQTMRDHGMNPHERTWVMQELNPIAAAGAAVNIVVWDLGPRAVVVVGDTLAQGDLSREAFAHQRAMQAHRDAIRQATAFALATRDAARILDAVAADRAS